VSGTDETLTSASPRDRGDVLAPGQTLGGRYDIDRVIGRGGMGVVYSGRDRVLERVVAVKVLRPEYKHNEELVIRFLNEARIVASLFTNPNIVNIFDLGRTDAGDPYLVMELLRGKSLRETLDPSTAMRPSRVWVLSLFQQAAGALVDAHKAGVAHRDLKPENVFVIDTHMRFVKVLDFGLAVSASAPLADQFKTRPGDLIGTPMYMSPEAVRGEPIGAPADLYAFGIMLYEIASNGQLPYQASSLGQWMRAHELDEPKPFPDGYTPYPTRFHELLVRLLAKDPRARPTAMETYRQIVLTEDDINSVGRTW
jgi:eukaryotic-like serine/threonine-protein kinase